MNNCDYELLNTQQRAEFHSVNLSERASILPALALAIYAALIPFDNVLWITKGWGTITKYLGILLALIIFTDRIIIGKGRIKQPPQATIWWLTFTLIATLSLLWSVDQEATIKGLMTLVGLIAVLLMVVIQPWDDWQIGLTGKGILIGGITISLFTIYLRAKGIFYPASERASLVINQRLIDPNHLGTSLILPLSIALNSILEGKKKVIFTTCAFIIMVLAISLTGSRGAIISAAAAAVFLYWGKRRSMRAVLLLILISAIIIMLVPRYIPPEVEERYSLKNILASQGAGRFPLWETAIIAFGKRPLTGWGYDSFSKLTSGKLAYLHGQVTHNIYLQVLSEIGVVGIFSLIMGLFASFRYAYRQSDRNPFYRAIAASLIGVAISSVSLGTLNYKYFWLTAMLALTTTYATTDVVKVAA